MQNLYIQIAVLMLRRKYLWICIKKFCWNNQYIFIVQHLHQTKPDVISRKHIFQTDISQENDTIHSTKQEHNDKNNHTNRDKAQPSQCQVSYSTHIYSIKYSEWNRCNHLGKDSNTVAVDRVLMQYRLLVFRCPLKRINFNDPGCIHNVKYVYQHVLCVNQS